MWYIVLNIVLDCPQITVKLLLLSFNIIVYSLSGGHYTVVLNLPSIQCFYNLLYWRTEQNEIGVN